MGGTGDRTRSAVVLTGPPTLVGDDGFSLTTPTTGCRDSLIANMLQVRTELRHAYRSRRLIVGAGGVAHAIALRCIAKAPC